MAMTRRNHQKLVELLDSNPDILSTGVTLSRGDYINLVRTRDEAEQRLMLLELDDNHG